MSPQMKWCYQLVKDFLYNSRSKHFTWIFWHPVDAVELGLGDYHKIIKTPMDLSTIKKKCEHLEYASPQEFKEDMILMFDNC